MTETKSPSAATNNHEIFASSSYIKVIDSINASIRNNDSLIALIGEPGTGKTLITQKIIKDQEDNFFTVFFQDPRFTIDEMLASAYEQIGITAADQQNDQDIDKKLKVFYQYLQQRNREKGPVRFFIDNAQDFSPEALSKILQLLEEQSDDNLRALQVILIGLPQLEPLLTSLKLAELGIENPIYLHLNPLDTEEIGAFVTQRLKEFGLDQNDFFFFPPSAITKIALYSQGIPSLVNILFDSIMATLNANEHAGDITDIVDEVVESFSLPASADNTNVHTIQTHREQNNPNHKESIQASSSNELNKTLISGIKEKVTDLFSPKKADDKSTTHDLRINANETEDDEEIFKVLAAELLNDIDNQDIELDMHGEDFETLMDAKEENHLDANHESEPVIRQSIQQNNQVAIMNMHEQTMNRGERITQELKALQSGSPDVEAVALISEDGLIVASALPQDLDELRVGGMSATLLSLGTRSSAELRRGKVEEIIVRGDNGYTVMQNAGRGMLLLVVTNRNAKLGLIFFDMHEAIEKIAYIL